MKRINWLNVGIFALILVTLLLSRVSKAETPKSYIEVSRWINSNVPSYVDRSGSPILWSLDMELHFPTFVDDLSIMTGMIGLANDHQFSQGGGKVGINYNVLNTEWNIGLYHLSTHSFEHETKFDSENRLYIRYEFRTFK